MLGWLQAITPTHAQSVWIESHARPLRRVSPNREKHRKQFQKLGAALKDYYTGEDSHFEIKSKAIQDPKLSSRLCGPQMKSQQFERTVRK